MFTPKSTESIKKHIRIAFANINKSEINELFKRLKDFKLGKKFNDIKFNI